jgi:transposase-like protein
LATGLHGAARTTPRVRAELQASQESTRALAARYGLNAKTVAKWRKRHSTTDQPMGPARPRSTVLTEIEEAIVVEFRRRTLLPLDDVLGCLRETIPTLSRSALHRCLQRHGIPQLPKSDAAEAKRGRFAQTTIGYVHIDVCELRWAEGKAHMFLAIDRVSKFAYVELHPAATMLAGAQFRPTAGSRARSRQHLAAARSAIGYSDGPAPRMCDASTTSLCPCDRSAVWEIVGDPFSKTRQDRVLGGFLPAFPDWADGNPVEQQLIVVHSLAAFCCWSNRRGDFTEVP